MIMLKRILQKKIQISTNCSGRLWLTLLQLVIHYNQKGHRDHEEVEDEAYLTQLTDGRPAHLLHHRLVSALATDGWRVAQDDQTTDQEHEGDLSEGKPNDGAKRSRWHILRQDIYIFMKIWPDSFKESFCLLVTRFLNYTLI